METEYSYPSTSSTDKYQNINQMDSPKKGTYPLSYREAFSICMDDFLLDFAFADIRPYVNVEDYIFTEDEIHKIWTQDNDRNQTLMMFAILRDKDNVYTQFLKVLQRDYGWLRDKVINTRQNPTLETDEYLNELHNIRSHFPKHADFNVHRFNYYLTTKEYLENLIPKEYLVIYGEIGFGKKWLALDVCCDYRVMKSVNFKIFWLDVHNCDSPEMDLEKLQRLKILLGEYSTRKIEQFDGTSNKILELQQEIRTILRQKEFEDCLLVLSDVQNKKTLETFYLPCKILITTRNKKIKDFLPKYATKLVWLQEGLTELESITLFEKVLEYDRLLFPKNANDLFKLSKGHPFLLNLIAQNLKGRDRTDGWNDWIGSLNGFEIKNEKMIALIQRSLRVLRQDEIEMYKTFAIFYHSVKIPLSILASLWDMSETEAKHLVLKFDKFSLITTRSGQAMCMLHSLYYSYLKNCEIDEKSLHKKLVESYNIESALEKRTELDISDLPDDKYFHYFIGYHIKEAEMVHLFPKLYLDFGFLNQKLRATGLPNTIGDLKQYRNEITGNHPYKERFIDRLLEFLPNIEEMLLKSYDTDLLQYALMQDGILRTEALKQASKFSERIWFSDSGHFHRRRQMVQLAEPQHYVRFIDADTCLFALQRNTIFLADLSCDYQIEPTSFAGHSQEKNNKIISIETFLHNYFISLDSKGDLFVWSFADERRRSAERRLKQAKQTSYLRPEPKKYLQMIRNGGMGETVRVKSFLLETDTSRSEVMLYVAFSNGNVDLYRWVDDILGFTLDKFLLNTKIVNIQFITTVLNRLIVINNGGSISIFNFTDGSSSTFACKWTPHDQPIACHRFRYGEHIKAIFVFAKTIVEMAFPREQNFDFLMADLCTLYEVNEKCNYITCSALSEDRKYLVLGTKQGILVFDVIEKTEVLRNSTSEHIVCIDIFSLDDETFKYVVISDSDKNRFASIFGLKLNGHQSLTWANSVGSSIDDSGVLTEENMHFEPSAWLIGKQLFDVYIDHKDNISLVAIDSKNRIHHFQNDAWNMNLSELPATKITSVAAFRNEYFIGCENGFVYDSKTKKINSKLSCSIIFLRAINFNILVASTRDQSFIFSNGLTYPFDIGVKNCWTVDEKYLLLLANDGAFIVVNTLDNFEIVATAKSLLVHICDYSDLSLGSNYSTGSSPNGLSAISLVGGCDFQNDTLVIGTTQSDFFVYKISSSDGKLTIVEHQEYNRRPKDGQSPISSVAINTERNLCAAGFRHGVIEVYKLEQQWKLLQTLLSHRSPVYSLKFSPWQSLNRPIILASISEQLCFWNISYVVNNPIDNILRPRRQSSRFTSNRKSGADQSPDMNGSLTPDDSGTNELFFPNVWTKKRGPSDKPELLSCIKLAGNRAEKFATNSNFTKFITIDDEGEVYIFSVENFALFNGHNGTNGNGTNGSNYDSDIADDEVIK